MKRLGKKLLLATPFLALIAFLGVDLRLRSRTAPPESVNELIAFIDWCQSAEKFRIVEGSDGEHLLAANENNGLLPSGPAAYVFDKSGHLTDWSSDVGDDSRFQQKWWKWKEIGEAPIMDREQALKWVQSNPDPLPSAAQSHTENHKPAAD